jgi:hypothetical protein
LNSSVILNQIQKIIYKDVIKLNIQFYFQKILIPLLNNLFTENSKKMKISFLRNLNYVNKYENFSEILQNTINRKDKFNAIDKIKRLISLVKLYEMMIETSRKYPTNFELEIKDMFENRKNIGVKLHSISLNVKWDNINNLHNSLFGIIEKSNASSNPKVVYKNKTYFDYKLLNYTNTHFEFIKGKQLLKADLLNINQMGRNNHALRYSMRNEVISVNQYDEMSYNSSKYSKDQ